MVHEDRMPEDIILNYTKLTEEERREILESI